VYGCVETLHWIRQVEYFAGRIEKELDLCLLFQI
jgi:hypothetical protein